MWLPWYRQRYKRIKNSGLWNCKQTTNMLNLAAAFVIFASAINALVILTPVADSRHKAGSSMVLTVNNGPNEAAVSSTVVLNSANGRSQVFTNVPVGVSILVNLNLLLDGPSTLIATDNSGIALPASTNIVVYRINPINPCYNPCFNPCYNPCYNPYLRNEYYVPRAPCNIPRIPCNIPRTPCNIPRNRCNVPRPRCRIRAEDASESSDAMEFVQSESQPQILYSGFTVYVAQNADNAEQFEEAQQQQELQQQIQQQVQQQIQQQEQVSVEQQA